MKGTGMAGKKIALAGSDRGEPENAAYVGDVDPDERIVVICHHGVRSLNVANWLRNQGFEQAQSLRGGIDAWSRDVDPAMARY